MKSLASLVHREYLEHRGAFLYAPAALLVLFALTMASGLGFNRWRPQLDIESPTTLKFFEVAFLGVGMAWFVYLMFALFFYYADAFNADRRNNSMLFWKSMPVSDFKVLASKLLAGLTVFPLLLYGFILLTGVVLYGVSGAASVFAIRGLAVPDVTQFLLSGSQIALLCVAFIGLALLWYAPFFAWVGMLSTIVGRWSIPLAFLIPGLAVLADNLVFRGVGQIVGDLFVGANGPRGGFILSFLQQRASFGTIDQQDFVRWFESPAAFDAGPVIYKLVAGIDWTQMAVGLVAAAVFVLLAAEYRRRFVVA